MGVMIPRSRRHDSVAESKFEILVSVAAGASTGLFLGIVAGGLTGILLGAAIAKADSDAIGPTIALAIFGGLIGTVTGASFQLRQTAK
jgi:hypothetical protein